MNASAATHIEKFYVEKIKLGRLDGKGALSSRSIQYMHRILSVALNEAVKKNIISSNPIKKVITTPKASRYKAEFYNKDEVLKLLAIAENSDMKCAIVLGVLCGLRRGEVLGLTWNNIDFDTSLVKIDNQLVASDDSFYFSKPKTESSIRTMFTPNTVMEILNKEKLAQEAHRKLLGTQYKDLSLICCNNDGTPINPKTFSKRFSYFLKKNELKHIRFHDLRHSYASLQIYLGCQMKVISENMGHANISTTADTYGHVEGELKRDVANKIDNLIFSSYNSKPIEV